MKKNIINFLIIIFILFLLFYILLNKDIVTLSFKDSLSLWFNTMLPSLFPFFVLSDILISYNPIKYFPKTIKEIFKKIFLINDKMLMIFFISMISGFPSNARCIKQLYDNNEISVDEANHIIMFTHFANPVFIINVIGINFFNNVHIGIMILCIQYLSNTILGIMIRNYFKHYNNNSIKDNNVKFQSIVIQSIKKAVINILTICGIIAIFLLFSTIICNLFDFNNYFMIIIKGISEITIGIRELCFTNTSLFFKELLTIIFISFGGFSVHFQVIDQIVDTTINYYYFLLGRVLQVMISIILFMLFKLV